MTQAKTTYHVPSLARRGARHAMGLLLQHIRADEPFATYGSIARLLEAKLRIPRVFPTHIGAVAGKMMDRILEVDEDAPLINALVTRPSGIPGKGFGGYYDDRHRASGGRHWTALSRKRKLDVVEDVRAQVRRYPDWDKIYRELFGKAPPPPVAKKRFTEKDGKPPETARPPGAGESREHKKLKKWVADNPAELGLGGAMKPEPEWPLLSGDRIDVLFSDGTSFVAVEVKSIRSSPDDLRRGIYQCVKYRAVIEAQEHPVTTPVRAILVSEERLSRDLQARARLLGVGLKVQLINELPASA
jgi:hypothetical protein